MKCNFVDRIERELLSALLDYAVPFLGKKLKEPKRRSPDSNLENIVLNSKPKIGFSDVRKIEELMSINSNSAEIKRNSRIAAPNFLHSFDLTRKHSSKSDNNYSINISYQENSSHEKLKISVKNNEKEIYSAEITNKKEIKDKVAPYRFAINYEDRYGEERISITYREQLSKYLRNHIRSKEDMSERVPLKWVNIHPETTMGGILGFTYIGDTSMGRRADLTGKTARMVDIHESIHTPDEYETRVLTSWIMEKTKTSYKSKN